MDLIKALVDGNLVKPNLHETFIWNQKQLRNFDLGDKEITSTFLFTDEYVFHTDLLLFHILDDLQEVLANNIHQKPIYSYYSSYEFPDACVRRSGENNAFFASVSKGMLGKICDIAMGYNYTYKSALANILSDNNVNIESLHSEVSYHSIDALSNTLISEECYFEVDPSDFIFRQCFIALEADFSDKHEIFSPWGITPLLISDMLRFVWVHEWLHVRRGHLDTKFKAELGLFNKMRSNCNAPNINEDESFIRRSLEFDADFQACGFLLDKIFSGDDTPSKIFGFEGTLEERAAIMCLAYTLITLYWSEQDTNNDINKRSHPTSISRFYYIRNVFNVYFAKRPKSSQEAFAMKFTLYIRFVYKHVKELELIDISKSKELSLGGGSEKIVEYGHPLSSPSENSLEEWIAQVSPYFSDLYSTAMDESDEYIDYLKHIYG